MGLIFFYTFIIFDDRSPFSYMVLQWCLSWFPSSTTTLSFYFYFQATYILVPSILRCPSLIFCFPCLVVPILTSWYIHTLTKLHNIHTFNNLILGFKYEMGMMNSCFCVWTLHLIEYLLDWTVLFLDSWFYLSFWWIQFHCVQSLHFSIHIHPLRDIAVCFCTCFWIIQEQLSVAGLRSQIISVEINNYLYQQMTCFYAEKAPQYHPKI